MDIVDARPTTIARQPIWLLGALLCATLAVLAAVTVILGALNAYDLISLTFILSEPLAAFVGGLIIARQPRNPVGWLIVAHACCFTLGEFCRQYALYGAVTVPGALPLAHEVAWPAYWAWGPGITCGMALLPFFFPNGRLVSPRWRFGLWFIIVVMSAASLHMAFQPGDMETPGVSNPLGFLPMLREDSPLGMLFSLAWVASMLVGVASLATRFWYAQSDERRQIQWLLYAAALLLIGDRLLPNTGIAAELLLTLSLTSIWVAIGIAVLRYRLYDIDLLINRTLVYGALTLLIIGLYIAIVAYLGAFFQTLGVLGDRIGLPLQLVATGVVAMLFQPLRTYLQRAVNRLLYGDRDEPYAVLSRLGHRLEVGLAPERVPSLVVETVATALKLPYVAIELRVEQGGQDTVGDARVTEFGNRPYDAAYSPLYVLPLVYGGEEIGKLLLARRAPHEEFSPADHRLLADLARQIGVALSAARLTVDLQHARERLVSAREEERRRLRRDLHDGLGPSLAAQTLKVGSARYFLTRDPQVADKLLADLERDIDNALGDVRRLVYNLRPPALDDLGLIGALDLVASQYRGGVDTTGRSLGMLVTIETPEQFPSLPAAVEVAIYRIVQEALVNAVRHGHARHCHVRLDESNNQLVLTISDDGIGIAEQYRAGVGLRSMRERAEELGGTCSIEALPGGGTRVTTNLPNR